jgi:hypothetical protein
MLQRVRVIAITTMAVPSKKCKIGSLWPLAPRRARPR